MVTASSHRSSGPRRERPTALPGGRSRSWTVLPVVDPETVVATAVPPSPLRLTRLRTVGTPRILTVDDYEPLAKQVLPADVFDYYAGGAGD